MEVKSEYFRCISNFIYSYENICDLEQVPVMKGEEGCRGSGRSGVWKERGPGGKVSGGWFSLDVKGKGVAGWRGAWKESTSGEKRRYRR